jgi:RNA polymerase sigma-70 factor, ECF subfamily
MPHEDPTAKVDRLLSAARDGADGAVGDLFLVVFRELRELAAGMLHHERHGHTLQPTALVNEAYLKLQQQRSTAIPDRQQFLAVAATSMRRILVDHARTRGRHKRGAGVQNVPFEDAPGSPQETEDLVAIDEALDRLSTLDPRMAKVVELRFFAGLDPVETAAALGMSQRTCERDWSMARAWLRRELTG